MNYSQISHKFSGYDVESICMQTAGGGLAINKPSQVVRAQAYFQKLL
jgi:hypothetical protein